MAKTAFVKLLFEKKKSKNCFCKSRAKRSDAISRPKILTPLTLQLIAPLRFALLFSKEGFAVLLQKDFLKVKEVLQKDFLKVLYKVILQISK